jgi:L,D-transpeptidase YbiS
MHASNPGGSRGALALPAPRPRFVAVVRIPRLPRGVLPLAGVLVAASLVLLAGTGYRYRPLEGALAAALAVPPGAEGGATTPAHLRQLQAEHKKLRASLARKAPRGTYIVIDQANNRLYLKRGDEVLLDAKCSAGSGMILREGENGRSWVFDTPRGAFRVLTKIEDPVWKKPDWAFIEEGKPIPKDPGERFEYGMLGEYALYFGDGYMIHGTLYERLLGRSVTHGCIRLGREDLRQVWRTAPVGTPIYIF